MSDLPASWGITTLGEVCDPPQHGWTTSATDKPGNVKLLRATDISGGQVDWATVPWCSEEPANIERYAVRKNDLLITRTGAGVGRAFLIGESPLAAFASYLIRFTPKREVSPRYLAYFLNSPSYWKAISVGAAGIAQPNVNATKLSAIELPIAPRGEQDRIVAEIEKQFMRLDAATAGLKRVQANLKRYRASMLKAACEGRLVPTEADLARKESRDYEPADQLLQRILRERRARWEADTLAKMIASGKPPMDDRWKERYKEPASPDIANLAALPEGWCWASVDSVIHGITAGRSYKCEERPPEEKEFGIVKVSAVTWGTFDELESKTCLPGADWVSEFEIRPGDFLFSRANTIDLVGACVIVQRIERRLMLSDKILRFECGVDFLKQWLLIVLRSQWGRFEIERLSTGNQESMRNIGQDRIRSIRVPLAPIAEMASIIAKAEVSQDVSTGMERVLEIAMRRSVGFRKAILANAFSGRLVPQQPGEEPASALLARIRSESVAIGRKHTSEGLPNRSEANVTNRKTLRAKRSLSSTLSEANVPLTPEKLFVDSGFTAESIDEFYDELRTAVSNGAIEEIRKGPNTILLRTRS